MPILHIVTPSSSAVVVQTTVANVSGPGGPGGAPDPHAATHHTGGTDVLTLGSIPGSLTAGQHGTLGSGDPHPQYATDTDVSTVQTNLDNLAAGMRFKDRVRVATTNNMNVANPGTSTIDGVALTSGDTVLLVGQAAQAQNGAYVFNGSGSAMTRRADSNTSAEVLAATAYPVAEGTFADQIALLTTNDPITLGATALAFTFIAPGAGISSSIVDAKGDLIVATADNTVARFPVGANGTVPIADSAQTFGIRWGTVAGVAGSGAFDQYEFVGTTGLTITVDRSIGPFLAGRNAIVVVGAGLTTVEVRECRSSAGSVLTVDSPLFLTHSPGELVLFYFEDKISATVMGLRGSDIIEVDEGESDQFQWAIDMLNGYGMWLVGGQLAQLAAQTYQLEKPIVGPTGTRLMNINLKPANGYSPNDVDGAMLTSSQEGRQAFTASAATNRVTLPGGATHLGTGGRVLLRRSKTVGAAFPGGITECRRYYTFDLNTGTNSVQLATSEANAVAGIGIDITSDGLGAIYTTLIGLERVWLQDFRISAAAIARTGMELSQQQPVSTFRLRLENATEYCVKLWGQISNNYDWELDAYSQGATAKAMLLHGSGHNFYGLNMNPGGTIVGTQTGVYMNGATNCSFFPIWGETMSGGTIRFGSGTGITVYGGNQGMGGPSIRVDSGIPLNSVGYTFEGGRISVPEGVLIRDDRATGDRAAINILAGTWPNQNIGRVHQAPAGDAGTAELSYPEISGTRQRRTTAATAITLTMADANSTIECTASSTVTVTLPSHTTTNYPPQCDTVLRQHGTGQIVCVGATGVVVNGVTGPSAAPRTKTAAQYGQVTAKMTNTTSWVVPDGVA